MNTEKLKNYKIFEDLSNENINLFVDVLEEVKVCLLYTSPSPRD